MRPCATENSEHFLGSFRFPCCGGAGAAMSRYLIEILWSLRSLRRSPYKSPPGIAKGSGARTHYYHNRTQ